MREEVGLLPASIIDFDWESNEGNSNEREDSHWESSLFFFVEAALRFVQLDHGLIRVLHISR